MKHIRISQQNTKLILVTTVQLNSISQGHQQEVEMNPNKKGLIRKATINLPKLHNVLYLIHINNTQNKKIYMYGSIFFFFWGGGWTRITHKVAIEEHS